MEKLPYTHFLIFPLHFFFPFVVVHVGFSVETFILDHAVPIRQNQSYLSHI